MSFILDALKKSAAERQLGEVPSLQQAGDISTTQQPIGLRRPLVVVMVLLITVAAGYFWYTKSPDSDELSRSQNNLGSEVIVDHSQLSEAAELPDYHPTEKLPEYRPPQNKQSPLANYTPPVKSKSLVQNTAVEDTPAVAKITAEITAVTESGSDDSDLQKVIAQNMAEQKVQKAPTEQQRIARLKKQRAAERAEDAALVAAVEKRVAAEKAMAKKKNANASGAQKLQSNSLSLSELPAAVRSNIPDVNISMQVYATEPANRFVIIDGKRYRQQDQLTEDVTLDEILRQGIILKYRQYRVLVK